jgi:IS5 family transposase
MYYICFKPISLMLGKTDKNPQLNLAEVPLIHFIDPGHELCKRVRGTDWNAVEKDFAGYYSPKGAPSIPIRTMVGLILLKQAYRYSDKSALAHWMENPYWQYFCGEVYYQHKSPFYFSDFSHFRKRIGKEGEKKILTLGSEIFGPGFAKGFGRKDRPVMQKGRISGMLNMFGNYLVKRTTH